MLNEPNYSPRLLQVNSQAAQLRTPSLTPNQITVLESVTDEHCSVKT